MLSLERAVAHTTRGRDGRQEGRERGYYHLHRNLNDTFFHRSFFCFRAEPQSIAEAATNNLPIVSKSGKLFSENFTNSAFLCVSARD